jgi:uncharacterized MAPEG superfamily protein
VPNSLNSPTFVAYAITCLVLSLNLLFLWAYSGAVRGRTRMAINPEDAAKHGVPLSEIDPPPVARVLRAHSNAQAAIYPFLLMGLVYVLAGGPFWTATIIFGAFVLARLAHSVLYLAGKQPWRTLSFVASGLATLALMGAQIWLLATAAR